MVKFIGSVLLLTIPVIAALTLLGYELDNYSRLKFWDEYQSVEKVEITPVILMSLMGEDILFLLTASVPLIVLIYYALKVVSSRHPESLGRALRFKRFFIRSLILFSAFISLSKSADYLLFEAHEIYWGTYISEWKFHIVTLGPLVFDIFLLLRIGLIGMMIVLASLLCCWPVVSADKNVSGFKNVLICAEATLGYTIGRVMLLWLGNSLLKSYLAFQFYEFFGNAEPVISVDGIGVFYLNEIITNFAWATSASFTAVLIAIVIARAYLIFNRSKALAI